MKHSKVYIFLIISCLFNACNDENVKKNDKKPKLSFIEKGEASWYGADFHGKITANGEIYDMNKLTAAHKTLNFGTLVKVTNLKNNKSVVVRINDRGPYINNRIIDLSKAAAKKIEMIHDGISMVKLEIYN